MQPKFGRSVTGAFASLAVLLMGGLPALAGSDSLTDAEQLSPQCANVDQDPATTNDLIGCARIRGYIAAGSDFTAGEKIGGRSALFKPPAPPIVTGAGSAEPMPLDTPPTRDPRFLQVSHDDGVR